MNKAGILVRYARLVDTLLFLLLLGGTGVLISRLHHHLWGILRSRGEVVDFQELVAPDISQYLMVLAGVLAIMAFTMRRLPRRLLLLSMSLGAVIMAIIPIVAIEHREQAESDYVHAVMSRYNTESEQLTAAVSHDEAVDLTHPMRMMELDRRKGLGQDIPAFLSNDELYARHRRIETACYQGQSDSCSLLRQDNMRLNPRRPIMSHFDAILDLYRL